MARLDNQLQNSGYVVSRLLTHVLLIRLTYEERKELQEVSFIFRREPLKENTLYNDSYRK